VLGQGVPDRADAEFVERALLAEEVDDLHHPAAFALVVVEPAEGRCSQGESLLREQPPGG